MEPSEKGEEFLSQPHKENSAPNLEERIEDVADGIIGVQMGLMASKAQLGEEKISEFLDKVPEKGEKLWLRFKEFQSTRPQLGFTHFIASVIMPNPLP